CMRFCVSASIVASIGFAAVFAVQPDEAKDTAEELKLSADAATSNTRQLLIQDIPKGTFVSNANQVCIESDENGTYYFGSNAWRFTQGRFRKVDSPFVAEFVDGEIPLQLRD